MKHLKIHVHTNGLFAGRTLVNSPEGRFYAHPRGTERAHSGTLPRDAREAVLLARLALRRTGFEHMIAKAERYVVRKSEPYGYTLATAE